MKTILLALLVPFSVSAQIVSNGDFQLPDITPDHSRNFPAGQDIINPPIPGWYVVFGDVDIIAQPGGQQVLDLNGFDTGGIQQTVTAPIDKYELSFTWNPNTSDALISGTHKLAAVVNWNSQTVAVLTYNVDNGASSQPPTVSLILQGHGNDTLQFISRNNGTGGIMIDNVTLRGGASADPTQPVGDPGLAPVPEPRQYAAIAGLGLCAFAAWRKYFRKVSDSQA